MKAHLISKPCPACAKAKEEFLPIIKMRYNVIMHDLRWENTPIVEQWNNVTKKIPAIRVGNGEVSEWYVGVDNIGKLAEMCESGEHPKPKKVEVSI